MKPSRKSISEIKKGGRQMINILDQKRIEKLLRQAGFPEVDKTHLLSVCPIPVLAVSSHAMQETMQMWGDIFDGKGTSIKEVSTAYYQCLLLGQVIGAKIISSEPDPNNPGDWKKENKIEVVVYRKISSEKWEKFTIIRRKDKQPNTISEPELNEITRVARFIKLVVKEYEKA